MTLPTCPGMCLLYEGGDLNQVCKVNHLILDKEANYCDYYGTGVKGICCVDSVGAVV